MVGDSNIRFKVPKYSDQVADCAVSVEIYGKDCATLSVDFENASNLIPSLSNGYYLGKLIDEAALKTY